MNNRKLNKLMRSYTNATTMGKNERSVVTIEDISNLQDQAIVYVTDEVNLHNTVVVSKWMYYYSILSSKDREMYVFPTLSDAAKRVEELEYCMEKVNLNPASLLLKESDGITVKFCYDCAGEEVPEGMDPDQVLTCSIADVLNTMPYSNALDNRLGDILTSNPFCNKYCGELTVAALHRIKNLRVPQNIGMGWLRVVDPNDPKGEITLTVVGYIETEADKLLAKGVTMDENSEEYKTVVAQLENPVFYSTCGNFLEQ